MMPIEDPTGLPLSKLQIVWREVEALARDFPPGKLKNRLSNLGIEEFVEGEGVKKFGFPFRLARQLDESILALAHFLHRFKKENGSLKVYALNRVSKGEDKDLAFWKDAKAKLYLELQNLILLLGKEDSQQSSISEKDKRTCEISRIFTFRKLPDLAFLTQAAINVLGEQSAAGIRIGFMFLDSFDTKKILPVSDTLIIDYTPGEPTPLRHNFYELYGLLDEANRHDLPYQESCTAKWFFDEEGATSLSSDDPPTAENPPPSGDSPASEDRPTRQNRLSQLLAIYRSPWETLSPETSNRVCEFERKGEFFNDATLMMYKAFLRSKAVGDYDKPESFIVNRINRTVITRDMIRLHRTMSGFTNAKSITAVDATSVKGSLKLHESRPTYRDWLRRSLNRVLRSEKNELFRIYILKDDEEDKDIEYQTLLRLMQYYLDYFHYEISEMFPILHRHCIGDPQTDRANFLKEKWFKKKWDTFPTRVGIYITATSVLKDFTDAALKNGIEAGEYPEAFHNILGKRDGVNSNEGYLRLLDYLRTDDLIYNFLNPRADTEELQFRAFSYRKTLINKKRQAEEDDILFGFMEGGLTPVKDLQVSTRINQLAASILDYADHHEDRLANELVTYSSLIGDLRLQVADANVTVPRKKLLEVRALFEAKLHGEFEGHFDYLYRVLKFQSVKVDFWSQANAESIKTIYPFAKPKSEEEGNLGTLQAEIRSQVEKNVKGSPPEFKPTTSTPPKGNATVLKSFDRTRKG
ncbi:MAG: hypothetical protein QOG23_1777 [Blastocatellia bacterium]|jgi:hypothetical protein|nr:hypothetical protein [Blastocatellia bacterium]